MTEKLKLVIVDETKKDPLAVPIPKLPKLSDLQFSTNGRKPKKQRGSNLYKRQMGRFRRSFRW